MLKIEEGINHEWILQTQFIGRIFVCKKCGIMKFLGRKLNLKNYDCRIVLTRLLFKQ